MIRYLKRTFVYFLLFTNLMMVGGFMVQSLNQSTEKTTVKSKDTINFEFLAEIEENETELNNIESYHVLPNFFFRYCILQNKQLQYSHFLNHHEGKEYPIDPQPYFCVFRI